MATLLQLVDILIGDVLAGNIYTNNDTYLNHIKNLQIPDNVLAAQKGPVFTNPETGVENQGIRNQIYFNSARTTYITSTRYNQTN